MNIMTTPASGAARGSPARPPNLLTVNDAASSLSLSVAFLNRLRLTGGGPVFVRLGRAVRYSPADLDNWIAARRRTSTADTGKQGGGE